MTTETTTTDERSQAPSMMAAPVEAGAPAHHRPDSTPPPARVVGLRCRSASARGGRPELRLSACFGRSRSFRREAIRAQVSRSIIEAREPGIWRYLELLPVDEVPARSLAVGSTPLLRADRLGAELGLAPGGLRVKDDTRNPTLSFKDRVVAIAAARAVASGSTRWPAPRPGTRRRPRRGRGDRAACRRLRPGRPGAGQDRPRAQHGATVVPVNGTYDEINRLSLEIADEEGWAFRTSTSGRSTRRAARPSPSRSPSSSAGLA
jgi:threonine synthase